MSVALDDIDVFLLFNEEELLSHDNPWFGQAVTSLIDIEYVQPSPVKTIQGGQLSAHMLNDGIFEVIIYFGDNLSDY